MAVSTHIIDEARKALGKLPLQNITADSGLERTETAGGAVAVEVYRCKKVEKAVLSTIAIHESGVSDESVVVWPADTYNFPVLWCTLTVVPGVMNVCICDFLPMVDCVVWPGYAEKYIAGVADLKARALDMFGKEVVDKAMELPSRSVYAFSPHSLVVRISDKGVGSASRVVREYIQDYAAVWNAAGQAPQGTERNFYRKKKEATRMLMKANDPGYPVMVNVFGEARTAVVFDMVF